MTTPEFIKYWNQRAEQVLKEIAANKWILHLTEDVQKLKENQNASK